MSDPVSDLYASRAYPAASHPSTDPAVTAVAAALAGFKATPPSRARILEIGCSSGHNLLPLAARWPESRCTGIDLSEIAIHEARETARLAGIPNVKFRHADLRELNPDGDGPYDYIIAHGVYSWVAGEVRQALLDFCRAGLSLTGVACISYNTLPGWSLRRSIVDLARHLATSQAAQFPDCDPGGLIPLLAMAAGNHGAYPRHLTEVLHDMLGKSQHIFDFDEFAPINEPCTFLDFAGHAGRSGLHYLGESELARNFPASLTDEAREVLKPLACDPMALQQTIDLLVNRTFRTSLLCRADAPRGVNPTTATLVDFGVRCPHDIGRVPDGLTLTGGRGEILATFTEATAVRLFETLDTTRSESPAVWEIASRMETTDLPALLGLIVGCARKGHLLLRAEPVRFDPRVPEFPDPGPLGSLAAAAGKPWVDRYHHSYSLDGPRRQLAAAMDGTRSLDELAVLANSLMPQLDFRAWCRHLASRGMFSGH